MSGIGQSGLVPSFYNINSGGFNSLGNSSGPSVDASSLVTDANSGLSCTPRLQRSTSFTNESYVRVPASPLSFSSNNVSNSSVMDGSCLEQVRQGASSATSPALPRESCNSMDSLKRSRIDMREEGVGVVKQEVMQQFSQGQECMQPRGHQNLQLQAMLQQQNAARQQQQLLMQSFPLQQAPHGFPRPQQLRNHMQPQAVQVATPAKRPLYNGICSRRLMQYLYHQRHRPSDNSLLYWTKFVMEYFAPGAKKRWCLSMYDNISNHALGVFPQSARDAWQCDVCGSKSGQGFETTFEVLPRLCQVKFDRGGVVDETMFLDVPSEHCLPSGIMVLEYAKVVQESVYEHLRVIREGKLQIMFTPELKICSWKFCARKHEEFLSRRMLAPQVNQLLQISHKYQTAVTENGSAGVPHQELQARCDTFVAAGRQLARNLDLQSLNDLGFSKRYVRCLQISEVVNSMKDLIQFSKEHNCGPIESLKNYTQQAAAKRQKRMMHEPEPIMSAPGSQMLNVNQHSVFVPNNYQNLLRGSPSPNQSALWQEMSNNLDAAKVADPLQFQGHSLSNPKNHPSISSLSVQQQQQPQLPAGLLQQNNLPPSQMNQHLQQRAIQQMLQDMMSNKGAPQNSFGTNNASGNMPALGGREGSFSSMPATMESGGPGQARNGLNIRNMPRTVPNNAMGAILKGNSFNSSAGNPEVSGNNIKSRSDLLQDMDLPDFDHIAQYLVDNGVINSEW